MRNTDEYGGGWDGLEFEMYDEFILEVCQQCLKMKVVWGFWIHPTAAELALFQEAKPDMELTLCSCCLGKMWGIQI